MRYANQRKRGNMFYGSGLWPLSFSSQSRSLISFNCNISRRVFLLHLIPSTFLEMEKRRRGVCNSHFYLLSISHSFHFMCVVCVSLSVCLLLERNFPIKFEMEKKARSSRKKRLFFLTSWNEFRFHFICFCGSLSLSLKKHRDFNWQLKTTPTNEVDEREGRKEGNGRGKEEKEYTSVFPSLSLPLHNSLPFSPFPILKNISFFLHFSHLYFSF